MGTRASATARRTLYRIAFQAAGVAVTRNDLERLVRDHVADDAAVTAILRAADEYGARLAGRTAGGLDAMRAWRDGRAIARESTATCENRPTEG